MTDAMENFPHTHAAVMTIASSGEDNNVAVEIRWEPELEGTEVEDLGYLPASYKFVQAYVMPMLEEVFMNEEYPELQELNPDSSTRN